MPQGCNAILAVKLLRLERFPKYQDIVEELDEFNPYACNIFVSHKWINREVADDGRYFRHFMTYLFRMINAINVNKFLDEPRFNINCLGFNSTYFCDRMSASDFYRYILSPTDEDLQLLSRYIDVTKLGEAAIIDIFGALNDIYVWFDYSCIPQYPRSEAEQVLTNEAFSKMHWMLENSYTLLLWQAEGESPETNEFYRGWCIIEVLIALYTNLIMYYDISTVYDLKSHQLEAPKKNFSDNYFSTQMENARLQADLTSIPLENYFNAQARTPAFIQEIFETCEFETVKAIFARNGVQCTYHNDMDTVINLYVDYRRKYRNFQVFNPIFTTPAPNFHRAKIINMLRNLYVGASTTFSRIHYDYIVIPYTNYDLQLLIERTGSEQDKPFYFDMITQYWPRLLYTQDPDLLIAAAFNLFDFQGPVYNDGLAMVATPPAIMEDIERDVTFPVKRSRYDYNLGLINGDLLEGYTVHLMFAISVVRRLQAGLNSIPTSMLYRMVPPLVKAGVIYKKARDRGLRSVLKFVAGRPWARRTLVLLQDSTVIYSNQQTVKGAVHLDGLEEVKKLNSSDPDADGFDHVILLSCTNKADSLVIRTETAEDCEAWLEHFNNILLVKLAREMSALTRDPEDNAQMMTLYY